MSTRFFTLSIAFGIAAMSITSNAAAAGKADFNGEGFANGTISIPFKDAGVADAGTVPILYSDGQFSALPAAWQHAHGDSANTGFARVDTDPADSHNPFNQLGPLAPGANPVIGPDGTLYIGNLAGELRAFHADGTPYWTRQINSEHGGIFAAPVVGADGSIYVVSSNHDTDLKRNDSFLHKFSAGGAWFFWRPFPEHDGYLSGSPADGGATTAPPNIWRANGTEAIMVPVLYPGNWGKDLRLLAFSTSGAVLGDIMVSQAPSPETTGGSDFLDAIAEFFDDCFHFDGGYPFGCGFSNSVLPGVPFAEAGWQLPGVAIRQDPQGGTPFVVMSAKQDKVTYAFSPQTGFSEVNRSTHTLRIFTTPPIVQGNGTTATGTLDGYLTFTDANFTQLLAAGGLGTLTAAPTRLADGRLVVISREGRISLLAGSQVTWQSQLMGESIASAAASCTHLFVATTDEFVTFDTRTMLPVAKLPWIGGGRAAPVIAPSGYVYAIASDSLFVFPPPRFGDVLATTACDQLAPPSISPGVKIVEDPLPPHNRGGGALALPALPSLAAVPTNVQETSAPPPEAGEVQERGLHQGTTPGLPQGGTASGPPSNFQAPTLSLTAVANAIRVTSKSVSVNLRVPANTPVTVPIEISVAYISPVGAARLTKTYAPSTGTVILYHEAEGDRKPRPMRLDISLRELIPNGKTFSFSRQFTVVPLYDVTISSLSFSIAGICDTLSKSDIRLGWLSPNNRGFELNFDIGSSEVKRIPEFKWDVKGLSTEANLSEPGVIFNENAIGAEYHPPPFRWEA